MNERAIHLRRLKPYPTYKDSGVEWLGEIPAHWEVKRLKHLAALNAEALPEETDQGLEMTYVDIGGVDSLGRIIEQEILTFALAPTRARRLVRDGDVIVSTVRTYLRAIAPIKKPEPGMVVSTGFAVVRPDDDLTTDYAAYALRAPYFVERVVANSKGVSFPAINESEMATYELARPPEPEQRAIAAFLDRETARLDALVAKKERLIELLQETRTALITRAVTKGLDPKAPMKDSGVEWLGEIPAQWELWRLKHVSGGLTVGIVVNPSQYVSPSGPFFLRGVDVTEGAIVLDRVQYISEDSNKTHHKSILRAGDLVSMRVGYPGVTAVVPPELDGSNCASLLITRRSQRINSELLGYLMNSAVGKAQFKMLQDGAAQEQINVSDAVDFLVPLPPLNEQRAIVDEVSTSSGRLDALIAGVKDAIERLRELRIALISAAVTGKIDVREEAA